MMLNLNHDGSGGCHVRILDFQRESQMPIAGITPEQEAFLR